jgi:hypothetical protein
MVELLVFYIHIVGVVTMFTKRWQDEGLSEGFLVVFFMVLIFFVGWSITTFLMKLLMEKEGFGMFFDRDAASLLLLTIGESVLYYFYLREEKRPRITDEENAPTNTRN